MDGTLYINADDFSGPEQSYIAGDYARVQIETPAADGMAQEWCCRECGEPLNANGLGQYSHEEEYTDHAPEPKRVPLAWCNSSAMTWSAEEDSVTVSISVDDPRGAFAFTVRRLSDGTLVMHTPYPGEPLPHMALRELSPGTYQIA